MSSLNEDQKKMLFDYSLAISTSEQSKTAEQLISSNAEAAAIYENLRRALLPLDDLQADQCPEYLAEKTIARLCEIANTTEQENSSEFDNSSHIQLKELLASEQAQNVAGQNRFWRNFGRVLAVAAVFLIFAGLAGPTLQFVKQKHQQTRCQMQLAQIGQGISAYKTDHDDMLPQVAMTKGAAWWRVGDQKQESHSNTRHIWMLVKQNYVDPVNFVCPGREDCKTVKILPAEVENLRDFPTRENITYSLQLMCDKSRDKTYQPRALMADLNPLFETLPNNSNPSLNIRLTKELLTSNSANHNRRGQNVLFGDGSVNFIKDRKVGISNDDIFTLKNTDYYQGTEVPGGDSDSFLVP